MLFIADKKILLNISCALLFSALFLLTFHLAYWRGFSDTYQVDIEFYAKNPGILVFYSPDGDGTYSQESAVKTRYSAGHQTQTVNVLLRDTEFPLRFDPDNRENLIQIKRLDISNMRFSFRFDGEELNDLVVGTKAAGIARLDGSLAVTTTAQDPQIMLQLPPIALELSYLLQFFTCLVLLVFFSFFCFYRIISGQPTGFHFESSLITLALLFAGRESDWSFLPMLLICFFLFSSLLTNLIALIKLGTRSLPSIRFYPLVITFFFITIIFFPLYLCSAPDSSLYLSSNLYRSLTNSFSYIFEEDDEQSLHNKITSLIHELDETSLQYFPFRKELIELNSRVKIFGFGFSPTRKAILGKNGMFFEGYGERRVEDDATGSFDNITDYMGLIPFSEEELEAWRVCLEERYYWLREQGIDYLFALAPTKALVYPEYLPAQIYEMKSKVKQPNRYEQLLAYLKENSEVPVVDLKAPLIAAKNYVNQANTEEDILLYYKTDFHWNYYGSFFAYRAIIDGINDAYPEYRFIPATLDEFEIRKQTDWVHRRFMYSLGLDPAKHKNETYFTFFPKPESEYVHIAGFAENGINDYSLPEYEKEIYGDERTTVRQLQNSSGAVPLIFVIGDSFSEKYMGFFSKHAKETISFRTVYNFLPGIFQEKLPDLVIQEVLSMYLLKNPPENPGSIKNARTRSLEKDAVAVIDS